MGERKITSNLKMKEKTKKARNWTKQETEPFERTLADREEDFINFLEKKEFSLTSHLIYTYLFYSLSIRN